MSHQSSFIRNAHARVMEAGDTITQIYQWKHIYSTVMALTRTIIGFTYGYPYRTVNS